MSTNSPGTKDPIANVMVTAPIIKIALAMGVAVFAVVAILFGQDPQNGPNMPLVWGLGGMGIATIFARLVVPGIVVTKGRTSIATGKWATNPNGESTDEGKLAMLYQMQMIIGSALLEGGAFANVFAYMSQKQRISLGMAALLWIGLLVDFPTRFGVSSWIERQLRILRDEKALVPRER